MWIIRKSAPDGTTAKKCKGKREKKNGEKLTNALCIRYSEIRTSDFFLAFVYVLRSFNAFLIENSVHVICFIFHGNHSSVLLQFLDATGEYCDRQ